MSDWNPQVVRIEKIEKHPDADLLEIATVLGDYPIVTKTGEYSVGDLAGYIPIDSIVPDTNQFYFLCPKAYEKYEDADGNLQQRQVGMKYELGSVPERYRIIKAKKIRGVYSQGMLIPPPPPQIIEFHVYPVGYNAGDPIAELVGLKKWEEPEEENLPSIKNKRADQASPPKGWSIPYYDIEGLRKYASCLGETEEVVLTEKIHGSNASFCFDGENLWVKSRNFYKKMDPDDMWWDVAIRYDLANKLAAYPMHIFFGEIYGAVKGFRYDTEIVKGILEPKIRFFDILNAKTMRYLDYDPYLEVLSKLELPATPELYRGVWQDKETMYKFAEGTSTLNAKHIREGFVLRTTIERYEPKLDSRMHIKLVGEGYNLQK